MAHAASLAASATPRHRRPIDVHVHIPHPIHLVFPPFDMYSTGELAVTVRDDGVETRGTLAIQRGGKLELFGHEHHLTKGSITFDEAHPHGEFDMVFERKLPDVAMRHLARSAGTQQIWFAGSPSKPVVSLHGAANSSLEEYMAMSQTGRPIATSAPNLPASETVTAPRGDQFFVLSFMATNLKHLMFLDRIDAWADPYQADGGYGQITNMEAERYAKDHKSRVRAVVRPTTPGRSTAELQVDRVLVNDDRKALGVGVRAGDRLGGGVGLFFEWSSAE
jgi:hypothetical protein